MRLGDIGLWQSGATPSKSNKNYFGKGVPWLNTGDLNDSHISNIPKEITQLAIKETSVKLNPKGSVLIAMYGATIGKLGILDIDATTNQACCACYKYWINQLYLFYFLLAWRPQFILMGDGGAQPNISKEKIEGTFLPCPPIKEQVRIVSQIKLLFDLFSQLEQSQSDIKIVAKKTKAKLLELAMQGKLVPQDPTDEPAADMLRRINPKAKIITDTPHYPSNWVSCKLGDLLTVVSGVSYGKDNIMSNSMDSIRILRGGNIQNGKICLLDDDVYISKECAGVSNRINVGDTIMVASTGSILAIGKTAYVSDELKNVHIGAFLRILRPMNSKLSQYLGLFFQSKEYKATIQKLAKGSNINNIKASYITEMIIGLPPMNEQKRIVSKIEELYSCLDNIEASLQS